MQRIALIMTLALASACGINANNFEDEYDAKFCDEWKACDAEFVCDDPVPLDVEGCEFNKANAKECLDAAWTCDQSNSAFASLLQPEACTAVWACVADGSTSSGSTSTATGTTTTTGTTTSR
jgi:hypothetical protein